jgi:threonine dehydrogenase-like Zn-dependent dehydrogenase
MAVSNMTGGRGADVVIEAVGSTAAVESAVEVVRRGGTVVVLGMYTTEQTDVALGVYWARTLDVRFSGLTPIHAWWERSMAAVADGSIDPVPLVSHVLPLGEAVEGYRMFAAHEATKVLLKP